MMKNDAGFRLSLTQRWLRTAMRNRKHVVVASGILLTIIGWFIHSSTPDSLRARMLAPRFAAANSGYQTLLEKSLLSRQHTGFQEIVEILAANDPKISRINAELLRKVHVVGQEIQFGRDRRPRVGSTIHVEVLARNETPIRVIIWNPDYAIKERFLERPLRSAGAVIFWIGIAVNILGLVFEVISNRRKSPKQIL